MVANVEALPPTEFGRGPEGGEIQAAGSSFKLALRSFMENRLAVAGTIILVLFVLFCWVGPLIYHGTATNVAFATSPPGNGYPLGTDEHGADVLHELMTGGQEALEIGFLAAAIATGVGTVYGAISGLIGGFVDAALMRVVDALLSIPFLFIVLIVASRYNASVLDLSIVIAVFSWLVPARLVRGEVLSLRVRDFVQAARVMGSGRRRIVTKHLIPNALGVVVVNVTFQVADAILTVAALGFLGFGLQYPHIDWGDMLSSGVGWLEDGYWWLVYPVGACLVLVVMAANFIGDGLRDAVDVRLRKR